jgi:hypothetical protein
MKTKELFFCLLIVSVYLNSSCKKDTTGPEANICSFVNPYLVDRPYMGVNIPDCGSSNVTVSNVQRDYAFGVVYSFDFTVSCSSSGKTYSGRIYEVEYSDKWIAVAYKVEINGKKCGRIQM